MHHLSKPAAAVLRMTESTLFEITLYHLERSWLVPVVFTPIGSKFLNLFAASVRQLELHLILTTDGFEALDSLDGLVTYSFPVEGFSEVISN